MSEWVAGWTHGNQFVCLAFQNMMAANIDGSTIHHWAGIPICDQGQGQYVAPRDRCYFSPVPEPEVALAGRAQHGIGGTAGRARASGHAGGAKDRDLQVATR